MGGCLGLILSSLHLSLATPSVSRVKVHSLLLEVRTGLPVPAAASLASSWFQTGQSPGGVGTGQNAVDSFSLSGV